MPSSMSEARVSTTTHGSMPTSRKAWRRWWVGCPQGPGEHVALDDRGLALGVARQGHRRDARVAKFDEVANQVGRGRGVIDRDGGGARSGSLDDGHGEAPAFQDLERGFVVVAGAHDDGRVHRRGVEQPRLGALGRGRGDEEHAKSHVAEVADDPVEHAQRERVPQRELEALVNDKADHVGAARAQARALAVMAPRSRGRSPPSRPGPSCRARWAPRPNR